VPAGTYKFDIFYYKNTDGGILNVKADGADIIASLDTYFGSGSQQQSSYDYVNATSSLKSLVFTSTSKHASSSGYGFDIQAIQLRRIS
jgi:hypothetical protein